MVQEKKNRGKASTKGGKQGSQNISPPRDRHDEKAGDAGHHHSPDRPHQNGRASRIVSDLDGLPKKARRVIEKLNAKMEYADAHDDYAEVSKLKEQIAETKLKAVEKVKKEKK